VKHKKLKEIISRPEDLQTLILKLAEMDASLRRIHLIDFTACLSQENVLESIAREHRICHLRLEKTKP